MARNVNGGASIARILVIAPLLAVAAYFGSVAYVSIVPAAMASWNANSARIEAKEARIEVIREDAREETYAVVCRKYFDASYIGKSWSYSRLSWCEKYEDRMPKES